MHEFRFSSLNFKKVYLLSLIYWKCYTFCLWTLKRYMCVYIYILFINYWKIFFFIYIFAAKLLTKGSLYSLKTKNEFHARTETILIAYLWSLFTFGLPWQCHFMFILLKSLHEFCFSSLNYKKFIFFVTNLLKMLHLCPFRNS